jgi:hypothetical protein
MKSLPQKVIAQWPRMPELKGKILVCWCKPLPCHGDVLKAYVDKLPDSVQLGGETA